MPPTLLETGGALKKLFEKKETVCPPAQPDAMKAIPPDIHSCALGEIRTLNHWIRRLMV
jgi:hypothetical protein